MHNCMQYILIKKNYTITSAAFYIIQNTNDFVVVEGMDLF